MAEVSLFDIYCHTGIMGEFEFEMTSMWWEVNLRHLPVSVYPICLIVIGRGAFTFVTLPTLRSTREARCNEVTASRP